jgi:hypothetical protein
MTAIQIGRPRAEVAAYAADPANATAWYENIERARGRDAPGEPEGSRTAETLLER